MLRSDWWNKVVKQSRTVLHNSQFVPMRNKVLGTFYVCDRGLDGHIHQRPLGERKNDRA